MAVLAVLAGCASGPRGGRDGPGSRAPTGLSRTPDAEPRIEPIRGSGGTSKPYAVGGRSYVPITDDRPLREAGLASWYGNQFHGRATASGEAYDMYAMTAAHKTLPLPSYVRVRNPANGREAIVRVNDRGPFHDDRVIDLSYTAALKLDLLRGVAPVEIERITNEDVRTGLWRRTGPGGTVVAANETFDRPPASSPAGTATQIDRENLAVGRSNIEEAGSVAVPMALTSPVVAPPRTEVRDLDALEPLAGASAEPRPRLSSDAPPAPVSIEPTRNLGGYWVQLGAFSQREGVERFQSQVAQTMPALASALNVFDERGTYRLQAGPYATREVARDTAEQVRNGMQLAPVIVERR